jgi:hypothetical protein
MLDVLNRPTGWLWGIGLIEYWVTVFGLMLFFLFIVESLAILSGWIPAAFVKGIVDFSRDEIIKVYVIVVDQIVIFIHVGITHSKVSIEFYLWDVVK